MDRIPCLNTAAARQEQRRIDARAAQADVRALTYQELRMAMLSAMQLAITKVPGYCVSHAGAYTESERPYVEELIDALDRVEPLEQFLRVLKDSECPMVAKLRVSLADVYARTTVDGVVQARSYA